MLNGTFGGGDGARVTLASAAPSVSRTPGPCGTGDATDTTNNMAAPAHARAQRSAQPSARACAVLQRSAQLLLIDPAQSTEIPKENGRCHRQTGTFVDKPRMHAGEREFCIQNKFGIQLWESAFCSSRVVPLLSSFRLLLFFCFHALKEFHST